jgi:hypothetical protein
MNVWTPTSGSRGPVGILAMAAAAAAMMAILAAQDSSQAPPDLRHTGLYADFAAKTVDPQNMAYSPQYPLWSDGAAKRRWVYLPPGAQVDASDPDVWDFPKGTKVWKQFSFGGRRVETRLIESLGGGEMRFASYVWNADETEAALVPPEGLRGVAEIRPGIKHDIPGVLDCQACHVSRRAEWLGFSALQLSPDRDPGAPNAEPITPDMINLTTLIARGLIRSYPESWKAGSLRIPAPNPRTRAALGYLHANCGNCHNPGGGLDVINLLLRHLVAPDATTEPALETAVNKKGRFRIPGAEPGSTFLIRPGDVDHSAVVYRMSSRNPFYQMPPLGTKITDPEALSLIRVWIEEDLPKETRALPTE